jgi:hypothetical protein
MIRKLRKDVRKSTVYMHQKIQEYKRYNERNMKHQTHGDRKGWMEQASQVDYQEDAEEFSWHLDAARKSRSARTFMSCRGPLATTDDDGHVPANEN